jgi:uncharacterized membrane protein
MLQQVLATLVRLLGLCFLIVGIGASVIILNEAWMLYKEPARIERFALAIESGSNLDKIFAMSSSEIVKPRDRSSTAGDSSVPSDASEPADEANLHLSYFAGWFLVLLLMLVASITAIAAVSAGGRLVLYDTDVRKLSRAVIKEINRNKGD